MLQILLCEDNEADIMLVRYALSTHQIEHELHLVTDGDQAIEFVNNMGKPSRPPCPDIFLLDLNLPKADGIEVLRECRRQSQSSQTPVIVMSSSVILREKATLEALGVSYYFRKPSDFEDFMKLGPIVLEILTNAHHVPVLT